MRGGRGRHLFCTALRPAASDERCCPVPVLGSRSVGEHAAMACPTVRGTLREVSFARQRPSRRIWAGPCAPVAYNPWRCLFSAMDDWTAPTV